MPLYCRLIRAAAGIVVSEDGSMQPTRPVSWLNSCSSICSNSNRSKAFTLNNADVKEQVDRERAQIADLKDLKIDALT